MALNQNKFVKFDVDEFIQEFKRFETHFKERVKLINSISFEQKDNRFIFAIDTPSTDMELKIGIDKNYEYEPPKTCYYLGFDMFSVKINYLPISKKQFESILSICKSISKNAEERKEEFEKAKIDALKKIFERVV